MELSEFAESLVVATDLQGKLAPAPPSLVDDGNHMRGNAPRWPGRPPELRIQRAPRVPKAREGMPDPAQRLRILHAFANHELQAIELFAWALLSFPEMPPGFRSGLLRLIGEEQLHLRLYLDRITGLGGHFGQEPVSGYFWKKIDILNTPLRFVSAMSLTFECANLDHSKHLAALAYEVGDPDTAHVLERIHRDELGHVRFGWTWLNRLKEANQSAWQAYTENLEPPLRPSKARGKVFDAEARRTAGLSEAFIAAVAASNG